MIHALTLAWICERGSRARAEFERATAGQPQRRQQALSGNQPGHIGEHQDHARIRFVPIGRIVAAAQVFDNRINGAAGLSRRCDRRMCRRRHQPLHSLNISRQS
jgi:hypothetical protein